MQPTLPYLYETHLHTSPVSKCARASVRENVEFYKTAGYAGIFITNHFIDGNINTDPTCSYEERLRFFFSDFEEGARIGRELDFPVFCGLEMSYHGTDFLVFGLDMDWFLSHLDFFEMRKSEQLSKIMAEPDVLVIQAHPFREASYIDHIRLFPRHVHGIEVYNANRTDFENEMAGIYAKQYGLVPFAGTDNHIGGRQTRFGGMQTDTPLRDVRDFIARVKAGEAIPFSKEINH